MTAIQMVPFKYPLNPKRIRWALWSYFDIPSKVHPGYVYLRRLRIIQTPWFGVYVHWIFMPDMDQDPHDHPWPFTTFIVRGSYSEIVYPFMRRLNGAPCGFSPADCLSQKRSWGRWSRHRMALSSAHQITSIAPGTISFVTVGRRRHEWGFYTSNGYVDWRIYNDGKPAGLPEKETS